MSGTMTGFLPTPWRDRAGRFSFLKTAVLLAISLPALVMIVDLATGRLGARPFEALQDRTGFWAAWLLMASLAVTPLRKAWRWAQLVPARRLIGVASACYALAHITGYAIDKNLGPVGLVSEIAQRLYLTVGFVGVLGLSVLAATSTDGMIRRLGGRRWRALHRLAYPLGFIAVLHYTLQIRLESDGPLLMAGVYLWLMTVRVVQARDPDRTPRPWVWAIIAVGVGVATMGIEALGLWLWRGFPPELLLGANVMIDVYAPWWGLRPGMAVLLTALLVAAGAWLRARPSGGRTAKARARDTGAQRTAVGTGA